MVGWWGKRIVLRASSCSYIIFDSRQRLAQVRTRSALLGLIKQQFRDTFIDKLAPDFGSLFAPRMMIMLGKGKTFPPGDSERKPLRHLFLSFDSCERRTIICYSPY
ncbi:hypothetical protein CDAR_587431 [Caerostris darwini]|uniref:Uncharacterized protein n=1 Tax=Caerostris darwini TaxID=1538125 RepID=A0AAV4SH83_9ARAC|nr:hypothetical protein CDAR_587431 [Caerostris darwini]